VRSVFPVNGAYTRVGVDEERVRESYGAAKYDRLARVKAEYDPDDLFHENADIEPAVAV
jgi:hypothetical protein